MSTFEPAVEIVLKQEGGYSNSSSDPGGQTNHGITYETFERAQKLFPQFRNLNLKDLSTEQATFIYEKMFWDMYPYNELTSQIIANKLFSLAVNMGEHAATLCLQRAINSVSNHKITTDGMMGYITISAANECDPANLLKAFRFQAALEYKNIIEAKPELKPDFEGLLKRAYS